MARHCAKQCGYPTQSDIFFDFQHGLWTNRLMFHHLPTLWPWDPKHVPNHFPPTPVQSVTNMLNKMHKFFGEVKLVAFTIILKTICETKHKFFRRLVLESVYLCHIMASIVLAWKTHHKDPATSYTYHPHKFNKFTRACCHLEFAQRNPTCAFVASHDMWASFKQHVKAHVKARTSSILRE